MREEGKVYSNDALEGEARKMPMEA